MEDQLLANASNASLQLTGQPAFSYYSLVITVFFLTPLLLFNSLLTVAIAVEKSVVGTLRLVLVNVITASQVVIVGLMMFFIANVIITSCWCPEIRPSDFACRLIMWVVVSGGAARLMYMTTFAVSIYVLVRYSAKKMKIWVAIVAVIGVWLAVLIPNAAIFSPDVVLINFNDNTTCAAHGTGAAAFVYAFGYTSVYGLLGFAVSVVSVIVTVWFVRHSTISGDDTLVKAMLKFAVFLVLGNVINFIGQTTPLLFAAFAPAGKDWYTLEKVFNYMEGVFILLSLVPTPVLILIYFKPVRQRIKRILLSSWSCLKKSSRRNVMSATNKTAITSHIGDNVHAEVRDKWLDTKGL